MYSYNFEKKTIIRDKSDIRFFFKSENIYLTEKTELICFGFITLSENITFSGIVILNDGVILEQGLNLSDVQLGKNSIVRPFSVLSKVIAGEGNIFGPFCFLRDNICVDDNCIIGAHVEVTRSFIGSNVKISHHAFIGDATIEAKVIVGANVVFCNFDGKQKQNSHICSGVTLGSATLIVSPIHIGENSIIGAGSIITKNILSNQKIIQKRN